MSLVFNDKVYLLVLDLKLKKVIPAGAQNIYETTTPEQSMASGSTEQHKARSFMYRESFLSSTLQYLIRK